MLRLDRCHRQVSRCGLLLNYTLMNKAKQHGVNPYGATSVSCSRSDIAGGATFAGASVKFLDLATDIENLC